MTTPTTGTILLTQADHLTRHLRSSTDPVSLTQWHRFDRAARHALLELLGPHANRLPPDTPSRRAARALIDTYPPAPPPPGDEPETRPDEARLIDRISVTIGALADLVNSHQTVDLLDPQTRIETATHLAALTVAVARHTLAHGHFADGAAPLAVGRHLEEALDRLTLPGQPARPVPVLPLTTIPDGGGINDALEVGIHRWEQALHAELDCRVPSLETIRALLGHYGHTATLLATLGRATHQVPEDEQAALTETAAHVTAVEQTWPRGVTTLTRPSHAYVTASRDLFESTQRIVHAITQDDPTIDARRALTALQQNLTHAQQHITALPGRLRQLVDSGLVFAPARALAPHPDRLLARSKSRHVAVNRLDMRPTQDAIDTAATHLAMHASRTHLPAPVEPSRNPTRAMALEIA